MKALSLLALPVLLAGNPVLAADTSWAGYTNLELTCSKDKTEGCTSHPAQAWNPYWTHRPSLLPDVADDEKGSFEFTRVTNAGKEVCENVGWQTKHMGWVPQGNGQVLTKWSENHSGVGCKTVGKTLQEVKKPVWLTVFTRNSKAVAAGLYTEKSLNPILKAGAEGFGKGSDLHQVCKYDKNLYGGKGTDNWGRMVTGHGYATLETGERVPATTFGIIGFYTAFGKYLDDRPGGRFKGRESSTQALPPICEVVRLDLRYAPKYQAKYTHTETKVENPSGSTLVHQHY